MQARPQRLGPKVPMVNPHSHLCPSAVASVQSAAHKEAPLPRRPPRADSADTGAAHTKEHLCALAGRRAHSPRLCTKKGTFRPHGRSAPPKRCCWHTGKSDLAVSPGSTAPLTELYTPLAQKRAPSSRRTRKSPTHQRLGVFSHRRPLFTWMATLPHINRHLGAHGKAPCSPHKRAPFAHEQAPWAARST
jgi:hypothetical protein